MTQQRELRCPPDLALQDGPNYSYDFGGIPATGQIEPGTREIKATVGSRSASYDRHQNIVVYDGCRLEFHAEGSQLERLWAVWSWLRSQALNRDAEKLAKAEGIEWVDAYDRVVKADEEAHAD